MVTLEVLIEHENEYGDTRVKAVGKTYNAPEQAAQGLIANGYAKDTAAPADGKKKDR